jgi:hypothetical protein
MRTLVSAQANYSSDLRRHKAMPRARKLVALRHLTTEEVCKVNLATIREGVNHCRWPKEVIEMFLTVKV